MARLATAARRSLLLILLAAVGGGAWAWWRDRRGPVVPEPAEWPPIHKPDARTSSDPDPTQKPAREAAPGNASIVNALVDAPEARSVDGDAAGWVDPNHDGSCPVGFAVKANDNSGIFHVPGGRFYDRTRAERCYSTPDAATADGYRRAKH